MSSQGLVMHPPSPGVPIDPTMFNTSASVATMLDAWGALLGDNYVRASALEALPQVCPTIQSKTEAYLEGFLLLPDFVSAFVEGVKQLSPSRSREETIAALWSTETGTDSTFKTRVVGRDWPSHLNFFAYGIGDAHYEEGLRKWLLDSGVCESVSLYGYDPYADVDGKDVILVGLDDVAKLPEQHLFLSRWALHHVPYAERWAPLSLVLDRVASGGLAFFAEEGVFASARRMTETQRAYSLLMSMLDTLINGTVLGHWFDDGDFFVDYLSEDDLATIESGIARPFRRHVEEHPCDFLRELTLVYDM